jgi:tetratricopeptide (TPR) repeat protein
LRILKTKFKYFDVLLYIAFASSVVLSYCLVNQAKLRQFPKEALQLHIECKKNYQFLNMEPTIKCLDKVISICPFNATAHYDKAMIFGYSGRLQNAIDELHKAIEIRPKYIKAYLEMGQLFERMGDLNSSIEAYTNAISINYRCDEAYSKRGAVYRKYKFIYMAVNDYNKALQINPGNTKAFSEKIILSQIINKMRICYHQAKSYQINKKFDLAIKKYSEYIFLNNQNPSAYLQRAICYGKINDSKNALNDLNAALSMDYESFEIYNERGIAYYRLKQFELAKKDFNRVIDKNPKYSQAYVNRGTVKTSLGEYKGAVSDFTKAISIDPGNTFALMSRGMIYMTHFKEMEKACTDWKNACELGQCQTYHKAKRRGFCN